MSQKSSLLQSAKSVSQVLTSSKPAYLSLAASPWVFPIPGNDRFVITSQHPDTIFSRQCDGTSCPQTTGAT
jgi:hypothetical protein